MQIESLDTPAIDSLYQMLQASVQWLIPENWSEAIVTAHHRYYSTRREYYDGSIEKNKR